MYKEKRLSRSEFVPIRGLRYHVQVWPSEPPDAAPQPLLVLVHGWMDIAASYQFMVDAFSEPFLRGRTLVAPDWRGFGQTASGTAGAQADNFWFPDYLADLDFLLDHYAPGQPVDLVGHSMGGNVAMLYAGVRPARIRTLVNLEGFGLPASRPSQAPGRYAKWLDELQSLHRGDMALKAYDSVDGVARRLMKTNPRLSPDKAQWLASHWARADAAGQWRILGEPAHKVTGANVYRADETVEIYRRISAPVLAVEAASNTLASWAQGKFTLADYHERLQQVPRVETAVMEDAGHMLHHDQPQRLADLIETFLSQGAA